MALEEDLPLIPEGLLALSPAMASCSNIAGTEKKIVFIVIGN